MSYRKKERELLKFDYVILALSFIGMLIYTALLLLVDGNIKLLFLIFLTYTIITFSKSLINIVNYTKVKKIRKYSGARVNLKLFNRRKRRVKKALQVQF